MLNLRRIAIGAPLLVLSTIAGQLIFGSKVSGDMVAAHWDSGPFGIVDITPVDSAEGRAYSVFWRGCTLNPDYDHRYCLTGSGLAPRSAIKMPQIDTLGLHLDISMLSVVFAANGEDCRSGVCIPFIPTSAPLDGVFTIYRGPGSYTEQSTGSVRRDDFPLPGFTTSQSFSGNRTRYSATFSGTVGPVNTSTLPGLGNATVTIMKGQQSYQTVYPAP